jgi:hypothetical protein
MAPTLYSKIQMRLLPHLLALHHLSAVVCQREHENKRSWHTKGHTADEKGYVPVVPA